MTLQSSAAAQLLDEGDAPVGFGPEGAPEVVALRESDRDEVLSFLAARPRHTVHLEGLIRDNGFDAALNRGTFYACRDAAGALEGVALVGHATLVEARTARALRAFALVAQGCPASHVIVGEQRMIEQFWRHYSEGGRAARVACREMVFEKTWPAEVREHVASLRLATPDDLDLVVPVHAQMAFEESGVNPLERDAAGFRRRCERRIRQGRVWVAVESGRLLFKADVAVDTPSALCLEGVYVAPEVRGNGFGLHCLTQTCRSLLQRGGSVVLLVDEKNRRAVRLYERAGFKLRDFYHTIFLQQED
jgi:predicted GNAT family acetyltransferase